MGLPSSGQLSIGDIRTELSSSSGSLATLSTLAGKSSPHAISEFYGYNLGAFIYDADESSDGSICLFLFHRDESDFNTTLTVEDHTRIKNGTTGQEMDYNFAASVEGNSDKFGIVLVINGILVNKILRVNDDNEMTSVTNC